MICILFNHIHFITRERGTCCVWASAGSCPIRQLSGETTTQQRFPRRWWRDELLGFHCETQQPRGWDRTISDSPQCRATVTTATASRSADISLFFTSTLYFHNNSTHRWHWEEMESQEMWTRGRRRQEIWFPSECAPYKSVLHNVGKAWWKWNKKRLRPHSSAGVKKIQKNKSCLTLDSQTPQLHPPAPTRPPAYTTTALI